MAVRSRAAHFLILLCFWLVALVAIGAITVARADSICKSHSNCNGSKGWMLLCLFVFFRFSVLGLNLYVCPCCCRLRIAKPSEETTNSARMVSSWEKIRILMGWFLLPSCANGEFLHLSMCFSFSSSLLHFSFLRKGEFLLATSYIKMHLQTFKHG